MIRPQLRGGLIRRIKTDSMGSGEIPDDKPSSLPSPSPCGMPRPVTHNHSRQGPQPGWYLGEPFTIRAGQVLAAGTLDIQKHNQLAATKQQAIQRRRPRATVQYIQAKFVYYAKFFQKLFYYFQLQPEIEPTPTSIKTTTVCCCQVGQQPTMRQRGTLRKRLLRHSLKLAQQTRASCNLP